MLSVVAEYGKNLSLEQVVRENAAAYVTGTDGPMPFSALGRDRSRAHRTVPVAVVAVTSASEYFAASFFEALKFLSESSEKFRVVLVGDAARPDIAKRFGWAVEHIHSERDAVDREDWLKLADQRVRWVASVYGAHYVDAPTSSNDVSRLLVELSAAFGVDRRLAAVAVDHFARLHGENGTPAFRVGWRGWLDTVSPGGSVHSVDIGAGHVVDVRVHRGSVDGVILCLGRNFGGELSPVDEGLRLLGWHSVEVGGDAVLPHEVVSEALLAVRDAFAEGGYVVLVAPARESIAELYADRGCNAAVWASEYAGRLTVTTSFGRTIDVREADAAGVLARLAEVRRIARTLAG